MRIPRPSSIPPQQVNYFSAWRALAVALLLLCFGALAAAQQAPPPLPAREGATTQAQSQASAPTKPQPDAQERADRVLERLKWFYDQRAYPSGHIPTDAREKALEQVSRMVLQTAERLGLAPAAIPFPAPTTWSLVGPQPINTNGGNSGSPTASGRVTALAVDPNNAAVVYAGAADGGVWKSADAGATWTTNFDQQPSLSIGSIAIAPSNSSIVYAGTGELNFGGDNFYGVGVIKSTDAGATWAKTTGTVNGVPGVPSFTGPFATRLGGTFIGSLAVNPMNASLVLAGVRIFDGVQSGIYCSGDGGTNWSTVVSGAAGTSAVYANATTAYAALGVVFGNAANGIYRSTNADQPCASQTWSKLTINVAGLDTTKFGRITLAVAPSTTGSLATTTIYAAIADSSTSSHDLLALLKTADSGNTWTQLTAAPNFCNGATAGKGQCFYDMAVGVHPTNPNFVVLGGGAFTNNSTTLFRSTDGGATWTGSGADDFTIGSSGVRPHVDHHAIVFSPPVSGTPKLYVGNDGGVWRTDDPTASPHVLWVDLNATLSVTEFYQGLSVHPSDQNIAFGGDQDNGTDKFSGTLDWQDVNACGDGAHTLIDPVIPSTVYANCQNIDIQKSVQNGNVFTFNSIVNGIDQTDRVQFIPPLAGDPSNNSRLYFGTCRVWQTQNAGSSWTAISGDLSSNNTGTCPGGGLGNVTALDVLRNNSEIALAATSNGKVWRTTNAGAGAGAMWSDVTGTGLPQRFITAVKTKRDDSTGNIAYVTFSGFSGNNPNFADNLGHVFKTTNGGATWTDFSGNLPNAPANDIVVDHEGQPTHDALYVATDVGVFTCQNPETSNCPTWTVVGGGSLPAAVVDSLFLRRESRNLMAGTHGRSAWNIQLTDVAPPPTGLLLSSISPATAQAGSAAFILTLDGGSTGIFPGVPFSNNTQVLWNGSSAGVTNVTLVSPSRLTAMIAAANIAQGGTANVSVSDPAATPNTSDSLLFTIINPAASPVSIDQNTATVGVPLTVHIMGTNFVPGIDAVFNNTVSIVHNTTGIVTGGGALLTVTLPGSTFVVPTNSATLILSNPTPGGGSIPGAFPFTVNANAGPAALLNPLNISFGSQNVGATSPTANVTLTNGGGAQLNWTSIALGGTNPGDFTLGAPTSGSACALGGGSLAPSGSCAFGVAFKPTASGGRTANVTLMDNAGDTPQMVSLSGTGVSMTPAVSLSTTSIPFGNQAVGTSSPAQTVTLTNTGAATLAITSIAKTGANASDFTLAAGTSGTPCPFGASNLAAGAACTFNVSFSPGSTGAKAAAITITSNAASSPDNVNLTGTGSAATGTLSLNPASANFGNQRVGTTSAVMQSVLSNAGPGSVTITTPPRSAARTLATLPERRLPPRETAVPGRC